MLRFQHPHFITSFFEFLKGIENQRLPFKIILCALTRIFPSISRSYIGSPHFLQYGVSTSNVKQYPSPSYFLVDFLISHFPESFPHSKQLHILIRIILHKSLHFPVQVPPKFFLERPCVFLFHFLPPSVVVCPASVFPAKIGLVGF